MGVVMMVRMFVGRVIFHGGTSVRGKVAWMESGFNWGRKRRRAGVGQRGRKGVQGVRRKVKGEGSRTGAPGGKK